MNPIELADLIRQYSTNAQVDRQNYEAELLRIVQDENQFNERVINLHRERERMEEEAEANRSFDPEILRVVISYKAR
jgi:hypothetical protein